MVVSNSEQIKNILVEISSMPESILCPHQLQPQLMEMFSKLFAYS